MKVLAHVLQCFEATGHLLRLSGVPRADADLEDREALEFTTYELSSLGLRARCQCAVKGDVDVSCPPYAKVTRDCREGTTLLAQREHILIGVAL